MARTMITIPLPPMTQAFDEAVRTILMSEHFKENPTYKSKETKMQETVWQRGNGYTAAAQYIKLEYQPTQLVIYGWIRNSSLIFTYAEKDLTGVYGFAVKKAVKNTMDKIVALAAQGNQPAQ